MLFGASEGQPEKVTWPVQEPLTAAEVDQAVAPSAVINHPRVHPVEQGKPQLARLLVTASPRVAGQIQPADLAEQRPPAGVRWVVQLPQLGSGRGRQQGRLME